MKEETYWPGEPTMRRLPGWPGALAPILKLCSGTSPDTITRCVCLLLNVAAAAALALLTRRVTGRNVAALFAGVAYAVHPVALHFAYLGLSEPLFLILVLLGLLCFVHGGRWVLPGFALHGLACLVRANFILWIGFAFVVAVTAVLRRKLELSRSKSAVCAVGAVLFVLPCGLWLARNYQITGAFPVLSTLRGQTFYGGNNPVVAHTWEFWGYWVFPDQVPGETPMRELAKSMSEYKVDAYYHAKGLAFLRENPASVPQLLLGKLVRAYLPIPWKPHLSSLVASAYRWLIYLTAAVGVWMAWSRVGSIYRLCLPAMLLANIAVVLVFWGYVRFSFAFEPFLLPFTGVALDRGWSWWRSRA